VYILPYSRGEAGGGLKMGSGRILTLS